MLNPMRDSCNAYPLISVANTIQNHKTYDGSVPQFLEDNGQTIVKRGLANRYIHRIVAEADSRFLE
jgi:hypothetical protein